MQMVMSWLPLDRKDIEKVVRKIAIAEYESVAIGLIHSYANDNS
jgi:N-methylhydantoinase A